MMAATAPKASWRPEDAPRLDGKRAIVTGATSGLGYETALALAHHGAATILAARNRDRATQILAEIRREVEGVDVRFERLDLGSLASIAGFAERVSAVGPIDILVNNAGVMGLEKRTLTEDGFETQIGVNYLGHFALTARLKDALGAAPSGGRVVNLASLAHRRVTLDIEDLQSERSYNPMRAYGRSKLAMLIFSLELQQRSERNRWNVQSVAAHPGWARTEIINNGIGGGRPSLKAWLLHRAFGLVAQPAPQGALPQLYAAMAPEAKGGAYYGPDGLGETRGSPGLARVFPQAEDPIDGRRLWAVSEKLTGLTF
jgi:NAD(P)-dependent dehydrogenase (short-subunit alcohol dehydrogenase family)